MKRARMHVRSNGVALISLLTLVFASFSCKKLELTQKLSISGQVKENLTGRGIMSGGRIRVDGFNSNASGPTGRAWKENLGTGTIQPEGFYNFAFNSWSDATHYYFYYEYPNNIYINTGSNFLNSLRLDAKQFNDGNHREDIIAAVMTRLKIDFRNLTPLNNNDSLYINIPQASDNILFGYLMPQWADLEFCTIAPVIWAVVGGANARGSMICNVPADYKFSMKWKTVKAGFQQFFQDSVLCPPNITTMYMLNY